MWICAYVMNRFVYVCMEMPYLIYCFLFSFVPTLLISIRLWQWDIKIEFLFIYNRTEFLSNLNFCHERPNLRFSFYLDQKNRFIFFFIFFKKMSYILYAFWSWEFLLGSWNFSLNKHRCLHRRFFGCIAYIVFKLIC